MLYKYLPVELFGINKSINTANGSLNEIIDEFRIRRFDIILINFNQIWVIQIFIAWLYCIKRRRFVPVKVNSNTSIFIKQLFFYLFTSSIVYLAEMLLSNTFFGMFERFAHHVVAILLFYMCYLRPNILCFWLLTPVLIHSIYWLEFTNDYSNELLFIYNLSLFSSAIIIMVTTYNRTVKLCRLRALIVSGLLYNVNIFGHRYGYFVNLFELDYKKAMSALLFSLSTSLPFYMYLIYVNYEKFTCKIMKHDQEYSLIFV